MFFQPCRLSHRCKRLLVNRCVSRTGCLGDLVVLNDYKTVQSNASAVTSQLLIDGVLLDIANLDVASLAVGGAFMDCNLDTRFKALSRTWHVKVAAITLQMRGLGCIILRITTAKGAGSRYKMCKEHPHISTSNIIKCSSAKLLQIPVANEDPSRKWSLQCGSRSKMQRSKANLGFHQTRQILCFQKWPKPWKGWKGEYLEDLEDLVHRVQIHANGHARFQLQNDVSARHMRGSKLQNGADEHVSKNPNYEE